MELREDEYEDELIDAFDAPEPKPLTHTKPPTTSPQRGNLNVGQPMRPTVQEFQTGLYPTFDEAPKLPEAAATELKKKQIKYELEVKDAQQYAVAIHDQGLMSEKELQRKQQQIQGEMKVYQKRFDQIAQVLAGETPHQMEERKKRQEERLERQEKRHEAAETRLLHQIERLEERGERRARIQARHLRASRSPSPSGGCNEYERKEGVRKD